MRLTPFIAFGILVLALVITGCTTTPTTQAPVTPAAAPAAAPTVPPGSPIIGYWVLESMVSAGTPVTLVPGTTITATFGPDGRFSGNDGCNQNSGSYMVTGSQLQVGPNLASTMMACEPQVMDQAGTYTRILLSPATWQVSGDRLTIQSGLGILVYVKQVPTVQTTAPPVIPPTGSWDLTSMTYMSGGSSMTVMPAGQINAIFGKDGKLEGYAGCNAYNAGYTTSATSMAVTGIIKTTQSCGGQLDTQERAYLGILATAARFENTGSQLSVYDAATPGSKLVFKPGNAQPIPIPAAIVGTWSLTGMTKGGSAVTLAAGVKTTAIFGNDGALSGNAGCNQYNGAYVLSGISAIGIGPLATTRMYCPEASMTQETNYLGILQKAATWAVDDASGKLTITDNTPQKNTLVYSKTA